MTTAVLPGLERRLKAEKAGEVHFDSFARGRYATDASSYQIMPVGVVVPRTGDEAARAIAIARAEGVSVLARGGGTSQCGQTVNESLVIDCSRHLNRIVSLDVAGRRSVVEPGIVLDELNRQLKPHGLWFPVDVSTASRATIGGMAGNNSCGTRSIRYGTMRDNVIAIDAILADGTKAHFGAVQRDAGPLTQKLLAIGAREKDEIAHRFPKMQRRIGGYNLDALAKDQCNLAELLVGSEGTLGFSTGIELKLSPLLGSRLVGVCHFGSFQAAMDAVQHLVKLDPIAVELIDRTMLDLAGAIAIFRASIAKFVRGTPEAILIVEFSETADENDRRMKRLTETMSDLGFGWDKAGAKWGGVIEVVDPSVQAAIVEVRTSGLNIMMSMKDERKPVSFIEDCAVPLAHLADYTGRLTQLFEKHGTRGTWYAHASVGCLHVRPVLNLKLEKDRRTMRAIAEEAFAMVREYKGSHSGEHGDGIVRSEFHAVMFGSRLVHAFGEVKDLFDPERLFNPGKIVEAPKFDDPAYLRYGPDYTTSRFEPELDWSEFPGGAAGLQGAVEMCNNNGACRKHAGGQMCPSYRVTFDERDVTRGRANVLRLALSGEFGPDALTSDAMAESLKLCVSCKACRRECPTGVDMAKMKIEVLAARAQKHGLSLRDRLVAFLPRYAAGASKFAFLLNLRDRVSGLAALSEAMLGLSARRALPRWRHDFFDPAGTVFGPANGHEVVLFADTFNRYFDKEHLEAAVGVLTRAGYRVHLAKGKGRPLCCGRTFLAAGLVAEASAEAERTIAALLPFARRGVPIVGLEPSCLFTFRDEMPAMRPGPDSALIAAQTFLFEEFIAREMDAGRFRAALGPIGPKALLHGHCHQKVFDTLGAVKRVLARIPSLEVETIESSCCGMAGAFGYQRETINISLAMAELSLLPAIRRADDEALVIADGTSCRQQIRDGSRRKPIPLVVALAKSIAAAE